MLAPQPPAGNRKWTCETDESVNERALVYINIANHDLLLKMGDSDEVKLLCVGPAALCNCIVSLSWTLKMKSVSVISSSCFL